jgi:diacylglycerol kinase family enzyme
MLRLPEGWADYHERWLQGAYRFRSFGPGITAVVLEPGHSLARLVDEAVADDADALGMAGGEGSLAVVAAAAAAHGLPFICVPAGTGNHFALVRGGPA